MGIFGAASHATLIISSDMTAFLHFHNSKVFKMFKILSSIMIMIVSYAFLVGKVIEMLFQLSH